jgi:hypothetical protein
MQFYRAFSSQLEKNGLREGQNIIVEYRAIDDPRGVFLSARRNCCVLNPIYW